MSALIKSEPVIPNTTSITSGSHIKTELTAPIDPSIKPEPAEPVSETKTQTFIRTLAEKLVTHLQGTIPKKEDLSNVKDKIDLFINDINNIKENQQNMKAVLDAIQTNAQQSEKIYVITEMLINAVNNLSDNQNLLDSKLDNAFTCSSKYFQTPDLFYGNSCDFSTRMSKDSIDIGKITSDTKILSRWLSALISHILSLYPFLKESVKCLCLYNKNDMSIKTKIIMIKLMFMEIYYLRNCGIVSSKNIDDLINGNASFTVINIMAIGLDMDEVNAKEILKLISSL